MDEMNDKLSALNESLSDDVDQVVMDLDELELKHQQDISKFYFQYKLQIFFCVQKQSFLLSIVSFSSLHLCRVFGQK